MERTRLNMRGRCSGSTPSEESALDLERNCCSHSNLPYLGVTSTNGPEVNGGQLAGSGQPPTITLVIDGNQS